MSEIQAPRLREQDLAGKVAVVTYVFLNVYPELSCLSTPYVDKYTSIFDFVTFPCRDAIQSTNKKTMIPSRTSEVLTKQQRRYQRYRSSHRSPTGQSWLFSLGNLLKTRLLNPDRLARSHSLQPILRTPITTKSHWSRSQHHLARLRTKDCPRA
jgi:hypothetical protein